MGKGKVLDNLFSEVSKNKNCNNRWLSCHVNDPSLVNGYCDKKEVINNFHKIINSTKIVKCRTEADFLFFGMQQNNKDKLLEDPFLHMLGMHDLWNMSHVDESPWTLFPTTI
jgi:hypothetical protein